MGKVHSQLYRVRLRAGKVDELAVADSDLLLLSSDILRQLHQIHKRLTPLFNGISTSISVTKLEVLAVILTHTRKLEVEACVGIDNCNKVVQEYVARNCALRQFEVDPLTFVESVL